MNKKQVDRRPDEKPAEQGSGKYDPNRPEPGHRISGVPEGDKGQPLDKQAPNPGMRVGRNDILDGDRSDRESGRPVQLEDDGEEEESTGWADAKPGLDGRQHAGREGQKPYEAEKTKR